MSQEPEAIDFPDAAPVTVEAALAAVAGWRASGMPLYGLHQIAIALAAAYQKERAEHRLSLGAARNLVAQHQKRATRVDRELQATRRERDAAKADLADLQRTFDLRWDADMRAVKRWRAGHPERDLIFPDRADLVVWLLEREGSSVIDDASPRGATVPGEGA